MHSLQRSGYRGDIALPALIDLALEAERFFGRPLPGVVHRTGPIPDDAAAGRFAATEPRS